MFLNRLLLPLAALFAFRVYRAFTFKAFGDGDASRYTIFFRELNSLNISEYLLFSLGIEPGSALMFFIYPGETFYGYNAIVVSAFVLSALVLAIRRDVKRKLIFIIVLTSPVFLGSIFFGGVRQLSAMVIYLLALSSPRLWMAVASLLMHKSGIATFIMVFQKRFLVLMVAPIAVMVSIALAPIYFSGRSDILSSYGFNPTSFLLGPLILNSILILNFKKLNNTTVFVLLGYFMFLILHIFIPGFILVARFLPFANIFILVTVWDRFSWKFHISYGLLILLLEALYWVLPYNSVFCYYSGSDFCSF